MMNNSRLKGLLIAAFFPLTLLLRPMAQAQSLDAFLDNGTVKVGVNRVNYGGSIVWLSTSSGTNLVNNYDKGRQIQQSYYAGNNITATNQSPSWSPWTWNPIMVGDYAGNVSPVLVLNKSGGQLYVKTQPYLWDRNNQLAQATIEHWVTLHPTLTNVVVVDNRLICSRSPGDEWGGPVVRNQELPAVYFVPALDTIKAYTNNLPWQTNALVTIPNTPTPYTGFPWVRYNPTEPWTACVDGTGFGAGVYSPIATQFLAGKVGSSKSWNTFDSSTMYIAPLGNYAFETNSIFSYRYYMIVGNLSAIRDAVYSLRSESAAPPPPPTGLAASPNDGQVSLTWSPSPDTTNYHVKCATQSGGPYVTMASVTTLGWTHTGLTNGAPYYYVVSASNAVGEGVDCPAVMAIPAKIVTLPNFGFETPAITTYQYAPLTNASWTFAGSAGISRNGSAFANPSAPDGVQVAFLQQSGGVFSNLLSGFTTGASYRVTFSAAQRVNNPAGQTWNLLINGSVIAGFSPPKTATNFVDYSAVFTATLESNTLAFVGSNLNGGDNTVFIDKVRVGVDMVGPLAVENSSGAVNLSQGVSRLQGTLTNATADVRIYWGTADGNTNTVNWASRILLTNQATGAFSVNASNLYYGLTYYYRCSASNASGEVWAPTTTNFMTQAPTLTAPSIGNLSFETPALAASGWSNNPAGATWSFSGSAGIVRNGGPWYSPPAPDGVQAAYMQSSGSSLSQSVTVVSAGRYKVSVSVVGRSGFGGLPLNVSVDDGNVLALATSDISTAAWVRYASAEFSLSAGTHSLQLVNGTLAGDHANAIDNIQFSALAGFITNRPAVALSASSAEPKATLGCTGAVYHVYVYWNTVNGGTNAVAWTNSASVGSWTNTGSANISCTVDGLNPATMYYFTFRAVNAAEHIWAENVQSCETLATAPGYKDWAAVITNGLTNSTDCATGDGYPNLLKYATGSSPTNSDTLAQMGGMLSNGLFRIRFNRNTNALDVTLIVEATTNLMDSSWLGVATNVHNGEWLPAELVSEEGLGVTNPVSTSVRDHPGQQQQFMRLKVLTP